MVKPGIASTGPMTGLESGVMSIMPAQACSMVACLNTGQASTRLRRASSLSESFAAGSIIRVRSKGEMLSAPQLRRSAGCRNEYLLTDMRGELRGERNERQQREPL